MKLLFIQGGTRLKVDDENNWYTDGNFSESVWKRYTSVCDSLTVILRREDKVYKKEDAESRFNYFNSNEIRLIPLKDIYSPISRYFSLANRREIDSILEREVKAADRVIIRSIITYYTIKTWELCVKYNKKYCVEVTGVAWDAHWYHSLRGKLTALSTEMGVKKRVIDAPYALYVTQNDLQKRYPCKGITVGCSNVELECVDSEAVEKRMAHIRAAKEKIVIGTLGHYGLKTKGQKLVIRAISKLQSEGITNIYYELVGTGDNKLLIQEAKKCGVFDKIIFRGSMPHDQVFEWLESIDIYIQPSYQEGLCRSVVEAMSKACPVITSDACGESELANPEFIFKRGDWRKLSQLIKKMIDKNEVQLIQEAKRGYNVSLNYKKDILDERRHQFYSSFMSDK